ncbi:glycoside hydrolase family 5 protein [Caulobacter endophyticus]|uniref:glycoside hydrolase family 5 protein n=1 Tax=Caulobacter endophyticus TaxID=2172652 RepID=UPI00240F1D5F|nr:cellulase family glycosylhydrolase [Caulobacter endophyticus]MDG2531601.1 cellulase family glycosylhydrolase [Caulobacter endophyticus]
MEISVARKLAAGLALVCVLHAAPAFAGFSVQDGKLVDACGATFVARGVNLPHAWKRAATGRSIRESAAMGSNTVRVVLSDGTRWRRTGRVAVRRILSQARRAGQVVILEVHDTTGYGLEPQAAHIGSAVAYWARLAPVLRGHENFVLINIGNEPTAGVTTPTQWLEAHRTAVVALRALGLRHTLVIDAHDYGQDRSGTMRDNAAGLFAADPLRNLVFDVHMYEAYGEARTVEAYLKAFEAARLPLIIGEFGPDHRGEPVDEEAIFRLSGAMGVGYLGWSWSGNAPEVADLDLVERFDGRRLTPWGRRFFDGPGGVRQTSRRSRVFSGCR